ncbi:serine-type D-Ala-D-Ala carboxypeptidase [Jeotgalibacillus soli]|uniref:Serine-type D-Ala-D-Ala carboxypeptidase n=2 Tax=Jeotgalibacillus soli TaxID=889306 RepID=A0A0C2R1Q4_9BACL|nr:serine-type D-Ala-D-Ala carboxypeptidase [Jeotgalibacillus soli]
MVKNVFLLVLTIFIGLHVFVTPSVAVSPPSPSAIQAILIEAESGRVLFEKDAHSEQRIASITKIMTAHLGVKHGNLNDLVTISAAASTTEGSSLYLKAGQKVTLNDLLYGLMLRSGNDSAVAIAEHISGSVEEFSKLMNKEAKRLGMKNSHFTNPHGLDLDDQHYSSAYDMALLTREAMRDDTFKTIFGTKSHRAESIEPNPVWGNKHRLVNGMYPHTSGGKTGFTKLAGRTLVTSANHNNMSLIAVTLRASNDWNDHMSLFEYGFHTYENKQILFPGTLPPFPGQSATEQYTLVNGFNYPLTKEESTSLIILARLSPDKDQSSKVLVKMGDKILYEEPLIKEYREAEPSWWQNFIKKIQFW